MKVLSRLGLFSLSAAGLIACGDSTLPPAHQQDPEHLLDATNPAANPADHEPADADADAGPVDEPAHADGGEPSSSCDTVDCGAHGSCLSAQQGAVCMCAPGYVGERCEGCAP